MLIALGMCSQKSDQPNSRRVLTPPAATTEVQDHATSLGLSRSAEPPSMPPYRDRANVAKSPSHCGWFEHSDSLTAKFHEASGSWTVNVREDHEGEEHWPKFSHEQWIEVIGGMGYGYGCACLEFQLVGNEISVITSSRAMMPQVCRVDPALPSERSFSD